VAWYRVEGGDKLYLATDVAETAMGYQVLEESFPTFVGSNLLVLGAELVVPFSDYSELVRELNRLGALTWEAALDRAELLRFDAAPNVVAFHRGIRLAASLLNASVDWSETARQSLRRQEVISTERLPDPRLFFRFSAAPVDPRVLTNGDWTPGTYGTTLNDLRMVPSGFAAVGRYALPNPRSARYVFPIVTDSSPVQIGTVTPNFGQAGGGVEVLFPTGAKAMTGVSHRIARE